MGGLGGAPLNLNRKHMNNTYVYFIQEKIGEKAPVKVGVARKPENRLAELQTGNSRTLIIISQIGPLSERRAYHLERQLHKKFKKHRIRGEWFTGVILQNIKELNA